MIEIPATCPRECGNKVFTFLGGLTFSCRCGAVWEATYKLMKNGGNIPEDLEAEEGDEKRKKRGSRQKKKERRR